MHQEIPLHRFLVNITFCESPLYCEMPEVDRRVVDRLITSVPKSSLWAWVAPAGIRMGLIAPHVPCVLIEWGLHSIHCGHEQAGTLMDAERGLEWFYRLCRSPGDCETESGP